MTQRLDLVGYHDLFLLARDESEEAERLEQQAQKVIDDEAEWARLLSEAEQHSAEAKRIHREIEAREDGW